MFPVDGGEIEVMNSGGEKSTVFVLCFNLLTGVFKEWERCLRGSKVKVCSTEAVGNSAGIFSLH